MTSRWRVIWPAAGIVAAAPASALADQTYLKEAEAPRAMFPASNAATRGVLELSDPELAAVGRALERRVDIRKYPYFEVLQDGKTAGFVFVMDVLGQTLPITFAVGVTADGVLQDVQVMVYREPRGEEIQEPRFRRQFKGKRLQDPLAVGQDVDAISGATISARSAAYAARKGLALAEVMRARLHRSGK